MDGVSDAEIIHKSKNTYLLTSQKHVLVFHDTLKILFRLCISFSFSE